MSLLQSLYWPRQIPANFLVLQLLDWITVVFGRGLGIEQTQQSFSLHYTAVFRRDKHAWIFIVCKNGMWRRYHTDDRVYIVGSSEGVTSVMKFLVHGAVTIALKTCFSRHYINVRLHQRLFVYRPSPGVVENNNFHSNRRYQNVILSFTACIATTSELWIQYIGTNLHRFKNRNKLQLKILESPQTISVFMVISKSNVGTAAFSLCNFDSATVRADCTYAG